MAAVRFSLGKGVKRKRGADDGGRTGPEERAPQAFRCGTLLDLSLLKLHQSCELAESNLRRSVLIANALRRLQAEICRESGLQPPLPADRPAPGPAPGAETPDLNNNLPATPGPAPPPFSLLSGNDSSLASAISVILQDLDFVEDLSPRHPPGTQPCPEDDHLLPPTPADPAPPDSTFGVTDSADFLVDGTLDAIFEDIDTSMYDPQLGLGLSAGAWGLAKAPPSPAKAHSSRTEFTELENLMDLLVG
uniref:SERTA domain-containing protein 1-like n=1 Tax=Pristiophorus japonicus TaxID=55135 RepID=UPI00398E4DBA